MTSRVIFPVLCVLFLIVLLTSPGAGQEAEPHLWTFHWELDETPEGQEQATPVEPIEVELLDESMEIAAHSASLALMHKYSVHLGPEWSPGHAYRLLQTFESIWPRSISYNRSSSIWKISDRHIQSDIEVVSEGEQKCVSITATAFVHATPLLAEIEGVRGRYFSKRLHRAVLRFLTDDGADRYLLERILRERYAVSINIPDYTELTRHTTGEPADRFSEFKNEELMALMSMFEEFPRGMLKTPGLNYLVRRVDGLPHPIVPEAAAVAWTGPGYIEFMELAFKEQGLNSIHHVILHEKAHFLWEYLFDEQLKQDWVELGGWFENPDDKDGWSTTKNVEFVSAYAHGKNPNEDMAESISSYIVNPNKLRFRAPTKYEFIQNRIMHGTRYISKIREDLTFEVYNLYPDYVYPGRIIRVDIQVEGKPEEDKLITVEIEIHRESDLDGAQRGFFRIHPDKGAHLDIQCRPPVDRPGGHILRGQVKLSKYAANGYYVPDHIQISDAQGNTRHSSRGLDFGWKLYIDNPLASTDITPPEYVPNSARFSLSDATTEEGRAYQQHADNLKGPQRTTEEGRAYQVLTLHCKFVEKNEITSVYVRINDENPESYSLSDRGDLTREGDELWHAKAHFIVPDYFWSGKYKVEFISATDFAGNMSYEWFTDELPPTIEIQTKHPDTQPPVLDVNRISIQAEPIHPDDPNGATRVDITFRVRDDISGYAWTHLTLRGPNGEKHNFNHHDKDYWRKIYFSRDPTVYETYHQQTILPVGSAPGTWGLAEMDVYDKAGNPLRADFTEIVRFEVEEGAPAAPVIAVLPDDTQLLANYPNPFNPETWIPYQLSAPAGVTISIYSIDGKLVRTLPLGHQPAGFYQSWSRAAYWDGCNTFGEPVATGLYFYTLTAGNFIATRKMLIRK